MSRSALVFGGVAALVLVTACGDDAPGGLVGTGKTVTETIGAGGGMVSLPGLDLVIPAGALPARVPISLTSTTMTAPEGYAAASPVYQLGPDGLTFAVPVTVRIALVGQVDRPTVLWSTRDATGFDDVGGTVESATITAANTHFSQVFAAAAPPKLQSPSAVVDFGTIAVSGTSQGSMVTITNTGGETTGPVTVGLAGTDAAMFHVASTTCASVALAAGEACTVSLTFSPTSSGIKGARLDVAATPGGAVAVALTGMGAPP